MKEKLISAARDKASLMSLAKRYLFWFATILYFEGLLHVIVFSNVTVKFLYILGFSLSIAGILTLATSFLPRKADLIVTEKGVRITSEI